MKSLRASELSDGAERQDLRADNQKASRCGVVSHIYACDREPGHQGDHRGYNEEHDEPVFWRQK